MHIAFHRARALAQRAWSPQYRRRTLLLLLVLCLLFASLWGMLWLARRPTGQRHYLVLGFDTWGNTPDAGRTDAMALVTLDFSGKRILFISLLRDTRITLPRGGQGRLNTLARGYDSGALCDYLYEQYGVRVEGTICVNFSGMVGILDALGGLPVELTAAEARYLRKHAGDYPGYKLREGACTLNGAQALAYMRCRELDNDMGRTQRQAKVFEALLQKGHAMSLGQAAAVLRSLSGSYATDLSLPAQLALLRDAFTLRRATLVRHQIPAEGTFRYGANSMLDIDLNRNRALLDALLQNAQAAQGTE